jgi:hypothetical protein
MPVNTYDDLIDASGKRNNVDPRLIKTTIHLESSGNPNVEDSPQGAIGLAQFLPSTAAGLKRPINPRNPSDAIDGMGQYLREGLDATGNSPSGALAFYHGGPDRAQWGPKTAAYVAKGAALYPSMSMTTAAQGQPQPMAQPASKGDMSGADILKAFLGKKAPEDAPDAPAQAPQGDPVSGQDILDRFLSKMPAAPAELKATVPGVGGVDDLGRPNLGADVEPAPAGQPGGATTAGIAAAGAVGRIGSAIAQGAQDGAQGAQPILTPEGNSSVVRGLQSAGIYPPDGQPGTMMQRGNRLVMGGIGGVISDGVQGGMNLLNAGVKGVLGGAAQTGTELVSPAFGRALGGLGEATMADLGSRIPAVRDAPINRLAPLAPEAFDRTITGPAGRGDSLVQNPQAQAAISRLPGTPTAPSSPIDPLAIPRAAEPVPVTQGALMRVTPPDGMPVGAVDGAPRPNSVGASATPDELARMTPNETRSARADAENAKLNEPQPVGPDYNKYVDGANVPMAHLEQSADISREQKNLESNFPNEYKDQKRIDNLAVQDHINSVIPSKTQINTMDMARSAQAEADTAGLWKTAKDADVGPLVGQVSDLLKSPKGKNDSVASAANKILAKLTNEDGSPITDAETLYEIRKGVANSYGKDVVSLDPIKKDGARVLHDTLLPALDHVIETAAPGYRTYMDNYASSSRAIETAQTLAEHQNRFTDTAGNVQLGRLKTVLKDIVEARGQPFETPEGRIPDETMQALWDARDHLRRASASDDLARAASSDSIPNLFDHMKGLAKAGVVGAAHLAIGSQWPLVGNWALNKAQSIYGAREGIKAQQVQKTRAREMLYPDRTNRLAPPRVD